MINGTAITHTPGTDTILLAPNQTYSASYTIGVGNLTGGGALIGFAFQLNGAVVPGSVAGTTVPKNSDGLVSSTILIRTSAGVNNLTVINNFISTAHLFGDIGSVTILKLQ